MTNSGRFCRPSRLGNVQSPWKVLSGCPGWETYKVRRQWYGCEPRRVVIPRSRTVCAHIHLSRYSITKPVRRINWPKKFPAKNICWYWFYVCFCFVGNYSANWYRLRSSGAKQRMEILKVREPLLGSQAAFLKWSMWHVASTVTNKPYRR